MRHRPTLLRLPAFLAVLLLAGCGTDDRGLNTDTLSSLLSISNLSRLPLRSAADPSLIVAVSIEVDVVNVGEVVIDEPFTLTWELRSAAGTRMGSATRQLAAGMAPGERRTVSLEITFDPVPDLAGVQDVVTFDLID